MVNMTNLSPKRQQDLQDLMVILEQWKQIDQSNQEPIIVRTGDKQYASYQVPEQDGSKVSNFEDRRASSTEPVRQSSPLGKSDDMEFSQFASPVKTADVVKFCGSQVVDGVEEGFSNLYKTIEFAEKCRKSASSPVTSKQATSEVCYKRNSYEDYTGKAREYKIALINADYGKNFYENISESNRIKNLDMLREEISKSVEQYYGGYKRITDIAIFNNQLIVNNVAFAPRLQGIGAIESRFPLDTYNYIKSGCIAPLFDWGYLGSMTSLRTLNIETGAFANDFVANDLGDRTLNIVKLFERLPNLSVLCIEGNVLNRDDLFEDGRAKRNPEKTTRVSHALNLGAKINKLYSDMNFNLMQTSNSVQGFFVDSLVSYAKNRGNKNFLHYSIGVVARVFGAGTAVVGNFGLHTVGGLVKGVAKTFKDAITPINMDE